jgi:hypothetical protein
MKFRIVFEDLDVYQAALLVAAARDACCPIAVDEATRVAIRNIGHSARSVPRGPGRARATAMPPNPETPPPDAA